MRNRDSSSDDEEDREHLIEQNHRKSHQAPSSPPRPISTFQIDDVTTQIRRRFANLGRKRLYLYLLLIFLPLFIIILFFTTDIRDLFSYNLNITRDTLSDHMRESELRALYLLKQQRSFLLSMFDSSNTNFSTSDFKSSLIKQISLNKEIQQVLLSPHKALNESTDGFGDVDLDMPKCSRLDRRQSDRKTVEWKPDSGKFLFAVCLSGQMSNHLICLEKHMFFAALLNRVLVIPSPKFDYQYDRVIDIKRINDCLGRKVVIEFDEFVEMKKNHPRIDKFICYFSLPTMCYLDEEHVKRLKGLGISMGSKLDSPWKEDVKSPSKQSVDDFLSKFGSTDDVIAIGDVFFADLEQEWVMQPGGPIAHKCKTLIEPSRLIMLTAQRFIQTFLGNNFVALHFRRHGFLKFCNIKNPSCFYPVPQSAECIARVVESVNAPVIYLSTDAAESETGLLQSLVIVNGKTVPLVKRPSHTSVEKWDALLYRHGLGEDSQAEAMLDKTICAMSSVFIGASGSTFTEDILRLRKDWLTASSCDEYLCQGELPNFIAENE